ncbi:MAG: hypothetical protein ACW97W_16145, partial [Candidatus Hodarchaeales archaeon]
QDDDDQGQKNVFAFNYWDEWTSPDADDDGIVDNPYFINGSSKNKDLYPQALLIHFPSDSKAPMFTKTPTDLIVEDDQTEINLSWTATDENPGWYLIFRDHPIFFYSAIRGAMSKAKILQEPMSPSLQIIQYGFWMSGVPITLYSDNPFHMYFDQYPGGYSFTCIVADAAGYITSHSITIWDIESITTTTGSETTSPPPYSFTTERRIPGWTFSIVLAVIITFILPKRLKWEE